MPKDESVNESTKVLSDEEKLERARKKVHEGRKLGAELARNLNASVLQEEREINQQKKKQQEWEDRFLRRLKTAVELYVAQPVPSKSQEVTKKKPGD